MSDKPILFSGPMVRALLAGTKTQTRRVIKRATGLSLSVDFDDDTEMVECSWLHGAGPGHDVEEHVERFKLPYAVGDRLYVREHWRTSRLHDETKPSDLYPGSFLHYIADGEEDKRTGVGRNGLHAFGRFRQGMHMPRWASRITLTVTDVRVQRLQEISSGDALAEGIQSTDFWTPKVPDHRPFEEKWWDDASFWADYPPLVYRLLWDSINGHGSWDTNPWVAAYTFSVALGNIDQIARAA